MGRRFQTAAPWGLSSCAGFFKIAIVSKEAENVALVQSLYAAFGRGDMETLIGALQGDIEWVFPGPANAIPFAGVHRGLEEVIQFFVTLSETLEFQKLDPREFIAQGDKIVVIGTSRVRNKANDRETDNEWVAAITVRDSKIARYQLYEDTDALAALFR